MTSSDFKSWFAIFSEAVDGTPTPKQWARIKSKVDELDRPVSDIIGLSNFVFEHASAVGGGNSADVAGAVGPSRFAQNLLSDAVVREQIIDRAELLTAS